MSDLFTLTKAAVDGVSQDLELVDVERAPQGLLRITLDKPGGVTIDDCEQVSRLLSRVYDVEDVDYQRLEVGSPGVDRPLRTVADFIRFAGERIQLKLRQARDNQRVFVGELQVEVEGVVPEPTTANPSFVLHVEGSKVADPLVFSFDDVEHAKLDPVLDFRKGKKK